MAKSRIPAFGTRPIRSDFYTTLRGTRSSLTRTNKARYAIKAVPNAVMHMQLDTYNARLCQVWDEQTGELHAVIKRGVTGEIVIHFMRQVRDDRRPSAGTDPGACTGFEKAQAQREQAQ